MTDTHNYHCLPDSECQKPRVQTIGEMMDELKELRKDRERLDWLAAGQRNLMWTGPVHMARRNTPYVNDPSRGDFHAPDVRAAIDKAITRTANVRGDV